MSLLLLALLIAVLLHLWISRRGATLTRSCRWRLDRRSGPDTYRCAVCGAAATGQNGTPPRHCAAPRR